MSRIRSIIWHTSKISVFCIHKASATVWKTAVHPAVICSCSDSFFPAVKKRDKDFSLKAVKLWSMINRKRRLVEFYLYCNPNPKIKYL